jgi:hypothetical protein
MEIYTDALTIFFFAYCLLYNAFLFFYVIVRHQTSSGLDAFAGRNGRRRCTVQAKPGQTKSGGLS